MEKIYYVAGECRKPNFEAGWCLLCNSMDHKKLDCPRSSTLSLKINNEKQVYWICSKSVDMLVENDPVIAVKKTVI